jgi:uncharacterized iron-regulated membrane protein
MSYERSVGMGLSPVTTFWGQQERCDEVVNGSSVCYTADRADVEHAAAHNCRRTDRSCRTTSDNPGAVYCCPPEGHAPVTGTPPSWFEDWMCWTPWQVASLGASSIYCAALQSSRRGVDEQAVTVAEQVVDQAVDKAVAGAREDYRTALNALLVPAVVIAGVGSLGAGGYLWWRRRQVAKARRAKKGRKGRKR